ncbi:MAG: ferrochelatase [Gammaproteobacteria bacterium]|nr:ferrochelatase [Gammaproteobacteria bacterium]
MPIDKQLLANAASSNATTGIIVTNLGTPAAPTPAAVREFLAEFLIDQRVIELPKFAWWPILHGIILRVRPARVAHAYRKIWLPEGSPLAVYTERLAAGLGQRLAGKDVRVKHAMRYGKPALRDVIDELRLAGVQRLCVLPLYPQYSATSAGTVFDAMAEHLTASRWVPECHFISDYHVAPTYIEAIARSIRQHWAAHGKGERLLMSFHGIPKPYADAGDPYPAQCAATAQAIANALSLAPDAWEMTFQSRFGFQEWVKPYFDERIRALPGESVKTVDVICPGFATDCLETLEEIAITGGETFKAAGGTALRYIPALNDCEAHLDALSGVLAERIPTLC